MVTYIRTEHVPFASWECVKENDTIPDAVIGHVIFRQVFEFDGDTKEAQESLVQTVSGDCNGRDEEFNRWTTWGAHEVPSKYSVAGKG